MYNLKIGVIYSLDDVLKYGYQKLEAIGINEIQMSCWNVPLCTKENAQKIKDLFKDKITISGLWAGWTYGPTEWNFTKGPATIGIVPKKYRDERVKQIKKVIDFANILNVKTVTTHMGFLPESFCEPNYQEVLDTIYDLSLYANQYNIDFCFETGQETPITIVRIIDEIKEKGLNNLKINLDPANLLLYGKANPSDAVDIFGKYIVGMHVKDGMYPTNGKELGKEKKVGYGKVDFPYIIDKLHSLNYKGPLTIEREIEGKEQIEDIKDTIVYLKNILNKYEN